MSLIFDSFTTLDDAQDFCRGVRALHPELGCSVFGTVADSDAHDPTPARLYPLIVHVERPDELAAEPQLERMAPLYGGRFVGT